VLGDLWEVFALNILGKPQSNLQFNLEQNWREKEPLQRALFNFILSLLFLYATLCHAQNNDTKLSKRYLHAIHLLQLLPLLGRLHEKPEEYGRSL
jgi:hypothetical protein